MIFGEKWVNNSVSPIKMKTFHTKKTKNTRNNSHCRQKTGAHMREIGTVIVIWRVAKTVTEIYRFAKKYNTRYR